MPKEKQIQMPEQKVEEMVEGQKIKRATASGFALEGNFVKNMRDKSFEIVATRLIAGQDLDHPGQLKEKLILSVKLADRSVVDYYPNKTSQKVIISQRGY